MSYFESPTSCDSLQYPTYLYAAGEFPTFPILFQWIKNFSFLFLFMSHNTKSNVLVRVLQGNRSKAIWPFTFFIDLHLCAQSLSLVLLCATPWTVAHQTLLSMGFSRQECWRGLPFPSPGDLPQRNSKGSTVVLGMWPQAARSQLNFGQVSSRKKPHFPQQGQPPAAAPLRRPSAFELEPHTS